MKKKRMIPNWWCQSNRCKCILVMRLTFLLAFSFTLSAFKPGTSQNINISFENATLREVFKTLKQETGVLFVFNEEELDNTSKISFKGDNLELRVVLDKILESLPYSYEIISDMVVIKPSPVKLKNQNAPQSAITIKGTVTDSRKDPLPGVTIKIKNTQRGTATDATGNFTLTVTDPNEILIFTFVGMEDKEVFLNGKTEIQVVLEETVESIKEVVVTGIFQRDKESFTGSSSTFNDKELKMIGNQNILQSLKTLDPSFRIIENNDWGSDPNRLPDIEIRGKSSISGLTDEYGANPNQPLFILDGFESTLETINDLSMDRVESITLLKDAAATAIYGSKAANGVVVVETKRPQPGTLRVNYNLNMSFSFADLSDYNLMNAYEKLTFEKLTGHYGSIFDDGEFRSETGDVILYNERMKEVARGVDTYWMSEPLRFATTHKHTLFVEGGDDAMRYSASFSYGDTQGVMKSSNRDVVNGNIKLIYRKGKMSFSNNLNIDYTNVERETVPFSDFSRANPYYRKYDEDGNILKLLENYTWLDLSSWSYKTVKNYSPLYNMLNNNFDNAFTFGFTNNLEIDWRAMDGVRVRGRFGITKSHSKEEKFLSPFNSEFLEDEALTRGRYTEKNTETDNYNGDVSVTYGQLFAGKHMVNAVTGLNFSQSKYVESGYQVQGFIDDDFNNPAYALNYKEGSTPTYMDSKRRSMSYYLNVGYAFDSKYLFDANFRADGSSVFGSSRKFTNTWAVGIGWNIHNESFFQNIDGIDLLKIRGSIGNPGNQNFSDYISMRIYKYNNHTANPFGPSTIINNFGNSELKWQKTLDLNMGFDMNIIQNRLKINFDYYIKTTDPLLVHIDMPSSVGRTSFSTNMGKLETKGLTVKLNYSLISRSDMFWSVNGSLIHQKEKYRKIDSSLEQFNEENKSRNMTRYYNGGSPSDLWTVRSVGIDPATGREIFLNKEGYQTFKYDYDYEVVAGNTEPKIEGVIGSYFSYKGISASVNFRYRYGGQIFMRTLYDKVENIDKSKVALNQDKRALYDRWKKVGDKTKFKRITMDESTPMSSRFIEDNNILTCEAVSIGYETSAKWVRTIGASSFDVRAYMNDIFRISTVKNERGIDYPFARSVSMSIGLRF